MTDTAGPFDGTPWSEGQWARFAATWAPSGVLGAPAASTTTGDLPLSVSGLSVGLGAGRAWVRGFGFERTGAAVMQAVSANTHASFSRRDRIVLRRNLATHTITPVLITGTPAGTPAAPALTQSETGSWDLPLFSFLVPPNSGTGITGLVDERLIAGDTGWLDLTPASGVTAGGRGLHYRVMDGVCYFSIGVADDNWAAGQVVTTFPASARPSAAPVTYSFPGIYANVDVVDLTLNDTGVLSVVTGRTGTNIGLVVSGSFPVG